MSWLFITLAGICEVIVVLGAKLIVNNKYIVGILTYIISFSISLFLLYIGMKGINISVAYAAYTGIGVVGTVIIGIVFLGENKSLLKLIYTFIITCSVISLKILG